MFLRLLPFFRVVPFHLGTLGLMRCGLLFIRVFLVSARIDTGLGVHRSRFRNFPAKRLAETGCVIRENLCVIAGARNGHIREPRVNQVLVRGLSIHMNQYAVRSESLAAVARNRIAVIQAWLVLRAELNIAT